MNDLAASSCEACRIDAPMVSDDEASVLIKEIEGWHLINDGVKKLKKEFNFSSYIIPVKTNNLIVFPSGLLHYTEVNTKEEARISISGDILLTMKPGVKTEHCIPHPSGWDTISN